VLNKARISKLAYVNTIDDFTGIKPQMNFGIDAEALNMMNGVKQSIDHLNVTIAAGVDINHNPFGIKMGAAGRTVKDALPEGGNIFTTIKTYLVDHKEIGLIIGSALLATLAFCNVKSKMLKGIIILAETLFVSYILEPSVTYYVQKLLEMANDFLGRGEEAQVDGLDVGGLRNQSNTVITMIGTCLSGAAYCLTIGKPLSQSNAVGFFKGLGEAPKIATGITYLLEFMVSVIKKILSWMGGEWVIEKYPCFQDEFTNYRAIEKRVNEFVEKMRVGNAFDFNNGRDCFTLERDLNILISEIPNSPAMASYKRDAYMLLQKLKPTIQAFSSENLGSGIRHRPTGVWISGNSATGKSAFLRRFITDLCSKTMTGQQWQVYRMSPKDAVYAYAYEKEFWDSYHGQYVTVIDEAGLMKEVEGATNDGFMAVIRMVNTFDFPLNMAELVKKGRTEFCSTFVIATSNRKIIAGVKSLFFPLAYINRFDVQVHMVPKKAYCVNPDENDIFLRRADHRTYPTVETGEQLSMEPYEFKALNLQTGEYTSDFFGYDEMLERVLAAHKKNKAFGEKSVASYATDIKEAHYRRVLAGVAVNTLPEDHAYYKMRQEKDKVMEKRRAMYNDREVETAAGKFQSAEQHKAFMEEMAILKRAQAAIENDMNIEEKRILAGYRDHATNLTKFESFDEVVGRKMKQDRKPFKTVKFLPDGTESKETSDGEEEEPVMFEFDENVIGGLKPQMFKALGNMYWKSVSAGIDEYDLAASEEKSVLESLKLGLNRSYDTVLSETVDRNKCPNLGHVIDYTDMPEDLMINVCMLYQYDYAKFAAWQAKSKRKFVSEFKLKEIMDAYKEEEMMPTVDHIAQMVVDLKFTIGNWKFITGITAALTVITGIILAYKLFFDTKSTDKGTPCAACLSTQCSTPDLCKLILGDSETQSGKTKSTGQKQHSRSLRNFKHAGIKTQALSLNKDQLQNMMKVQNSATYILDCDEYENIIHAFFFKGQCCYFPCHFYDFLKEKSDNGDDTLIIFRPIDGSTIIKVWFRTIEDSIGIIREDLDMVFAKIPNARMHTDVIDKFIGEGDALIAPKNSFYGCVPTRDLSKSLGDPTKYGYMTTKLKASAETIESGDSGVKYRTRGIVVGNTFLNDGDCSLNYWTAETTHRDQKIIGAHIAGRSAGNGKPALCVCAILTKQDMLLAYKSLNEVPVTFEVNDDLTGCANHHNVASQFRVLGVVKNTRSRSKNNIVPSELHDTYSKSLYAPAKVTEEIVDGILKRPLDYAQSKVCLEQPAINGLLLDHAANSYIAEAVKEMEPSIFNRGLLPYKEAIMGSPGIFNGIPISTSPGYPYSEGNPGKGKLHWIGDVEGGYDLDKPEAKRFIEECEGYEEQLKSGVIPWWAFKDAAKVERRLKAKVDDWKTRSVNPCFMGCSAIVRRFFGCFMISFQEARLQIGSALGINPMGSEWDVMARMLGVHKKVIAGDYSAWDGRVPYEVMVLFSRFCRMYYAGCPEWHHNVRDLLIRDMAQSKHLITVFSEEAPADFDLVREITEEGLYKVDLDDLYDMKYVLKVKLKGKVYFVYTIVTEWLGGVPSGHPLTTIMNIFCNQVVLRYAIADCYLGGMAHMFSITCADPFPKLSMHYVIFCFGDDNVFSISDWLSTYVSQSKLTDAMSRINLIYTDEGKTGKSYEWRELSEVSFLKRMWVWQKLLGRYVAPLELTVILEIPQWKKVKDPVGAMGDRCRLAILELSYHGKDVWNYYAPDMIATMIEAGIVPVEVTWEAALSAAIRLDVAHC
jgi:hypothetical protein